MGKSESVILKEVMLEASKHNCRLWRNNRGLFYTIDSVKKLIGLLSAGKFQEAINFAKKGLRQYRAGLEVNGAGDLIGVHLPTGRFLSCEVKKPGGRLSPEQSAFIDFINKNGGIAFVIDDKNNFEKLLYRHIKL